MWGWQLGLRGRGEAGRHWRNCCCCSLVMMLFRSCWCCCVVGGGCGEEMSEHAGCRVAGS